MNLNEHTFVTEVTVISGRAFAASLVFGHDTRGAVGAVLHTAESCTEHIGCWHFVTTPHTLAYLGGRHVYPRHGGTSRPGGPRGPRWCAVNNKTRVTVRLSPLSQATLASNTQRHKRLSDRDSHQIHEGKSVLTFGPVCFIVVEVKKTGWNLISSLNSIFSVQDGVPCCRGFQHLSFAN